MDGMTPERLAELRAEAERATEPDHYVCDCTTLCGGVCPNPKPIYRSIDNEAVLALIAALEAKTAEVEGYRRHFPCDGGCSYGDGPQEECSLHGRNPRELWEVIGGLARERDEARAEVDAKADYVSDLEEQVRQRDNHVIPVLHARIKEAERERDEARAEASKIEGRAVEWSKRAETAEAAAKYATGRMIDARALLQQMDDRIDPFVFDELASELDDQPLDANGDTFEHRLDRAEAALERVKGARANYPECDKYDDDSPITCGWKRTVQSIDAALQTIQGADDE